MEATEVTPETAHCGEESASRDIYVHFLYCRTLTVRW